MKVATHEAVKARAVRQANAAVNITHFGVAPYSSSDHYSSSLVGLHHYRLQQQTGTGVAPGPIGGNVATRHSDHSRVSKNGRRASQQTKKRNENF
jgi:hypothetical protein